MTLACALCGQPRSETCCAEIEAQREAYRAEQIRLRALFDDFGIQSSQLPSIEFEREWATVPNLASLVAFLEQRATATTSLIP